MLITNELVILNMPKTGSTFVRDVVKSIYHQRAYGNVLKNVLSKLKLRPIGYTELMTDHPLIPGYRDQHGCYDQVPKEHLGKPLLSVVRDPYTRLASMYKSGWWQTHPAVNPKVIESQFPGFPDLSFEDYLRLGNLANEEMKKKYSIKEDIAIGNYSFQFIRFFFKNHREVLKSITREYITERQFKRDLIPVHLLRTENLNEELSDYLSAFGFAVHELDFIRNHKKVNVSKGELQVDREISQTLTDYVNTNEWILLEILETLGFHYKRT